MFLYLLQPPVQWTGADLVAHTPDATHSASGSVAAPRWQLTRAECKERGRIGILS